MREMKDSGIELIESIPNEWKIIKTGYLFRENVRPSTNEDTPLSLSQVDGLIATDDMKENSLKTASYEGWKRVEIDDLVLNRFKAHLGVLFAATLSGKVSFHYGVYEKINDLVPKYFEYLYHTNPYRSILGAMSNGMTVGLQNLSNQNFYSVKSIFPPISEQAVIVDFLDEQCAEIDSLISDIQSQIEALEEYKRSVITEAVTKGLDPDVDMRDSGIAWVGDIPAHWITHPLYFYFGERKNKNALGLETNLLSLSYGKIIRKDINSNGGLFPESFNTYNIIEKDDIIIRPTDLQNDKRSLRTGIAREHGIITSAYIAMKAIKSVNPEYFHYLLHAYDVMKVFYNMGNGVRQGLNFSEFSRLMVLEPPIKEQNDIVVYLKDKCDEIDLAIAEKKQQIETIEEYKKSLIFEYVTGKKEISDSLQTVTIQPVLLLAMILREFGNDLRGKIHAQKAVYLCEMVLGSRPNAQYFRYEQGPYDEDLDSYLKIIHTKQWFIIHNGNPMTCTIGEKYGEFEEEYKDIILKYSPEIKKIVDFIRPMRSSQAGRIATLYAVWNDMIIDGITNPSDTQIIDEVTTNWTVNKRNPDRLTWQDTLNKMKDAGIVPTGKGLHTKAKTRLK